MIKEYFFIGLIVFILSFLGAGEKSVDADTFKTSEGDLVISFVGHGSLMITFDQKVIHVDPFSRVGDYSKLPKADLILITHHHGDHLDTKALRNIKKKESVIIATTLCTDKLANPVVMKNGDSKVLLGIKIEAVPAYNIKHKRKNEIPFHPRGEGNGYILSLADKRIYIAGDTENIPEMKELKNIDIAFLPMNLPYTMTPRMVADAARAFNPSILYPYHYGKTDTGQLVELLKDKKKIEVRIRKF